MTRRYWSRLAVTSFLGMALSYFAFLLLAALPIRYLRLTFGRKIFLTITLASLGIFLAFSQWTLALQYGSICLLIGFYRELEEKKVSIFLASSAAVLATMSANVFAVLGYTQWKGANIQNFLTNKTQPLLLQLQQIPQFKETTLDTMMWYLPSGIIISLMLILFVSLTVGRISTTRQQQYAMRMFRVPDWGIWVFIGSLAGTFILTGVDWLPLVAKNILAVSMAAYFFQGLAVFTYFLDRLRLFGFWRMLAYFLAIFQFFMFISGLGILDYWFDFRVHGLTGNEKKKTERA